MFMRKIGNTTIAEYDGVLTLSVEDGGTIIIHGPVNIPAPDQPVEELNTVRQDKPEFQSSIEIDVPAADTPEPKKGLETYEEYCEANRLFGKDPSHEAYLRHIGHRVAGFIRSSHMRTDRLGELLSIIHQEVLRETSL